MQQLDWMCKYRSFGRPLTREVLASAKRNRKLLQTHIKKIAMRCCGLIFLAHMSHSTHFVPLQLANGSGATACSQEIEEGPLRASHALCGCFQVQASTWKPCKNGSKWKQSQHVKTQIQQIRIQRSVGWNFQNRTWILIPDC